MQLVAENNGVSTSSSFAREGTAAHEVAADCVENNRDTWEWVDCEVPVEGETFTVDEDMAAAVQVWVETAREDMREYHRDTGEWPILYVEVSFDLGDVREGMFGTSDIVMLMPKWKLVRVYDYKHGVGIAVEANRNGQLMYYALGALHHLGEQSSDYQTVELVIVQPRNDHYMGPVRRWRLGYDELLEWADTELLPAVDRTREEDAPLQYGDHCRFCPAKAFCPALIELANEAYEMGDDIKPLTDAELSDWMRKRAALRHFLRGLDDEAYHRLTKGNEIPGYKLVPKRSARTWVDGAEEELKNKLGDTVFEKKLLTPAKVEKMKGGAELARKLAVKPETGLTLTEVSDNRPEVKARPAADVFKDF